MVSPHISFVSSMSAMSKPCTSVLDEPRPVPNSKRLFVRWSSSATFSAMRCGRFTGGVMLKIAEPRWTRSVCAAQKDRNASGPGMWLYSSRKWCCGHQTYLNACWSAAFAISTLRKMRLCSAFGSTSRSECGTKIWAKTPNSIGVSVSLGQHQHAAVELAGVQVVEGELDVGQVVGLADHLVEQE